MKPIALFPLVLLLAGATAQTPAKKAAPATSTASTAAGKPMPFKDAKLAAIDARLTTNKTAGDRADALNEAAELAFDLSYWSRAKGYAETYLKEFPQGQKTQPMQLTIGRALGKVPGSEAEAKKA